MAADLPSEFDVVVLGTGMPESIVAAACSRIGQAVLHLDRNEYYSGDWASFNLQGIEDWAKQFQASGEAQAIQRPNVDENGFLEADESLIQLSLVSNSYTNVNLNYYVEEGEEIVEPNHLKPKQPDQTEVVNEVIVSAVGVTDIKTESADIHPEPTEQTLSEGVKNIEITDEIPENKNTQSVESDATKTDEIAENKNIQSVESGELKSEGDNSQNDDNNKSCDDKKIDSVSGVDNSTQDDEAKLKMAETLANSTKWTVNRLKAEWRKFNLDLSPKVIYSGGDMVELLISSDIAKYCEFKTVTRMLTLLNGELEKVLCSRSDVFSSKKVSMIEKRMLMKFLQFCADYENKAEEIGEFLHRPFPEFLAHKKLTANVTHYIQHSIAMATNSTTTEQGLKQMKKFIKSIGRYGNTAFLWSLYGSGELPQSFCRMCAVFGGLYCLRMSASSMIVNKENKCTGIVTTEGQKISCKWLIMENSYAPANFINQATARISRAIIMTDKPLLDSDQQELSLMSLPCPDDADRPIVVLELPPSSQACAKNTYTFHLTRKGSSTDVTPEDDLCYVVNKLFNHGSEISEDRPTILWSLYFSQCDMSSVNMTDQVPTNVILMSGPGPEIDIDRPVKEAREVFSKILPEEEFLPKAPNPDDIIYVDDSEAQVAKDNSLSEFEDTDNSPSETSTAEKPDNDTEVQVAKDNSLSEVKDTDNRQSETGTEVKPDIIEESESAECAAKGTEDKTQIETVGMDSKDKET